VCKSFAGLYKTLYLLFSVTRQGKNLKTKPFAQVKKVLIYFYMLSIKYSSGNPIPLTYEKQYRKKCLKRAIEDLTTERQGTGKRGVY
jgi:hypothetical protein